MLAKTKRRAKIENKGALYEVVRRLCERQDQEDGGTGRSPPFGSHEQPVTSSEPGGEEKGDKGV